MTTENFSLFPSLEIGRLGNYLVVRCKFDSSKQGGFGYVDLHVHAALWNCLLKRLGEITSKDCGLALTDEEVGKNYMT